MQVTIVATGNHCGQRKDNFGVPQGDKNQHHNAGVLTKGDCCAFLVAM